MTKLKKNMSLNKAKINKKNSTKNKKYKDPR